MAESRTPQTMSWIVFPNASFSSLLTARLVVKLSPILPRRKWLSQNQYCLVMGAFLQVRTGRRGLPVVRKLLHGCS